MVGRWQMGDLALESLTSTTSLIQTRLGTPSTSNGKSTDAVHHRLTLLPQIWAISYRMIHTAASQPAAQPDLSQHCSQGVQV